ncbi:hypothetical protein GCM10010302_36220 [Streptomyces polychromogenes]|uniref:Uncharacterized protein n=1 Tax=Streptomyces polychromogenes TaxID=67342 RepID=A0ABN0VF23_9ACTN
MQSHGECDLGVPSVVTMRTTRDRAVKPITYARPSAQRREARLEGDGSVVSDCNVELRNHPHPGESM